MWWTVAGLLIIVLIGSVAVVVGAPISFSTRFRFTGARGSILFHFFWMHPRVLSAEVEVPGRATYTFLGRSRERLFAEREEESMTEKAESAPAFSTTAEEDVVTMPHQEPESRGEPLQTELPVSREGPAAQGAPSWFSELRRALRSIREHPAAHLLRNQRLRARILRWALRSVSAARRLVRFGHVHLHLTGGASDPSITGQLYGSVLAVNQAIRPTACRIEMVPRFDRTAFRAQGDIEARTSVGAILWLVTVFLLSFPYITSYRAWRAARHRQTPTDPEEDRAQ